MSLIMHHCKLIMIVQLHDSKLFLILKSGVNHKSRGSISTSLFLTIFFFQAEDGIRDADVTGVQTCALPISALLPGCWWNNNIPRSICTSRNVYCVSSIGLHQPSKDNCLFFLNATRPAFDGVKDRKSVV